MIEEKLNLCNIVMATSAIFLICYLSITIYFLTREERKNYLVEEKYERSCHHKIMYNF